MGLGLGDLVAMAKARSSQLWDHTSELTACLVNVNRDKKKRAISPAEIHPHRKRRRQAEPMSAKEGIRLMWQMTQGGRGPERPAKPETKQEMINGRRRRDRGG